MAVELKLEPVSEEEQEYGIGGRRERQPVHILAWPRRQGRHGHGDAGAPKEDRADPLEGRGAMTGAAL